MDGPEIDCGGRDRRIDINRVAAKADVEFETGEQRLCRRNRPVGKEFSVFIDAGTGYLERARAGNLGGPRSNGSTDLLLVDVAAEPKIRRGQHVKFKRRADPYAFAFAGLLAHLGLAKRRSDQRRALLDFRVK